MEELTLNKAYELRDEIMNDSRYLLLLKLEKEMENDDEVCALSYKKDVANNNYNDMLKIFPLESEEVKKAQKELYEAKKTLESHPKVREYLKAYQEVRILFDEINKIIFEGYDENLCPQKEK